MPIIKSARKARRQNIKHRQRNAACKRRLKSIIKEAKQLAAQNNNEAAKKMIPMIYKLIDKAAKEGIVKPNAAARKKSRTARLIAKPAA